ncbi:MAG: phosphatidylglycerophosphatase A [Limnochordaceae bacterium]|uniref:Phosphatidylglycerophosphatase A n=1 Tax=Carboxydichorda subterranea TaxID=3109565 RepID=A0ABZ1BUI0_9FIRM|nr:phosphatidylglycerophosphatase A [Limnochorda sp. L945t]MBE3597380.1 phosphatidylglycerophosphatase A [Limnochordaceae bacterium]WRP16429.1 phosphatidylglycerophosphatase A [Limnochorda sp. L945t]
MSQDRTGRTHKRLPGTARALLALRGVDFDPLVRLVFRLQKPYVPDLTLEMCRESVDHVVEKREVQYAILTGVTLDVMAEEGRLDEPLATILREERELYGVDRVLALSIVNVYGSIGLSNFGYLDEERPAELLQALPGDGPRVHTFVDDILAAIVAAACARIAHRAADARQAAAPPEGAR